MKLESFLANKPLFYSKIDYQRFPSIYKKIKTSFNIPYIIHVVGTNAKGSTGRALAHFLYQSGVSVGHYSSPHIMKFNERIWLDGKNVKSSDLELAHKKLQGLLSISDTVALSYFEYTTLLSMMIFSKKCEYVVLEAGMGGEFDATNVFEKKLSIITPIGLDHESFLGLDIKEIAKTKLNSVNGTFILSKQYEKIIYKLAEKKADKLLSTLYLSENYFDDKFCEKLDDYIRKNRYPNFFKDNFITAFCAFALLGFKVNLELLNGLKLFGRCQKIAKNVTIDVGHNPMAAEALVKYFSGVKVVLIYNSYNDKNYGKILKILKPIIDEVMILKIENKREVLISDLSDTLDSLKIHHSEFSELKDDKEYLVFGSFAVVERFLNQCQ